MLHFEKMTSSPKTIPCQKVWRWKILVEINICLPPVWITYTFQQAKNWMSLLPEFLRSQNLILTTLWTLDPNWASKGRFKFQNLTNFGHWCQFMRFKIYCFRLMSVSSFSTQIWSEKWVLKFQNFPKYTQIGIGFGI